MIVHGKGPGRFGPAKVCACLDKNDYSSYELLCRKPVHESVERLLAENGRVGARTVSNPAAEAKSRLARLEAQGTTAKVERPEIVSDRSFSRRFTPRWEPHPRRLRAIPERGLRSEGSRVFSTSLWLKTMRAEARAPYSAS